MLIFSLPFISLLLIILWILIISLEGNLERVFLILIISLMLSLEV